jgi:hypothetical protein
MRVPLPWRALGPPCSGFALAVLVAAPPAASPAGRGPSIASITPASTVGATVVLAVEGGGFDPAAAMVEVYRPDGGLLSRGTVTERSRTHARASLPLAGAPPGSYVVKVVNPDGARSEGAVLRLSSEVGVSPAAGPPGTVFTYTGRGFKGGFGVTSHLEGPDGLEWQAKRFPTTPEGRFEHPITSAEFRPGTYTVWALDDYTGIPAARVTFEVTLPGAAPRPAR